MRQAILTAALLAVSLGAAAGGLRAQSAITDFKLSTCSSSRNACVQARSAKAEGSFIRPLYSMNDLEVEITAKDKTKSRKWRNVSGWIDLDLNQLVIVQEKQGTRSETVVDLNDATFFEADKL